MMKTQNIFEAFYVHLTAVEANYWNERHHQTVIFKQYYCEPSDKTIH